MQVTCTHADGEDIIQLLPLYDLMQHRSLEYDVLASMPGSGSVPVCDLKNTAFR